MKRIFPFLLSSLFMVSCLNSPAPIPIGPTFRFTALKCQSPTVSVTIPDGSSQLISKESSRAFELGYKDTNDFRKGLKLGVAQPLDLEAYRANANSTFSAPNYDFWASSLIDGRESTNFLVTTTFQCAGKLALSVPTEASSKHFLLVEDDSSAPSGLKVTISNTNPADF